MYLSEQANQRKAIMAKKSHCLTLVAVLVAVILSACSASTADKPGGYASARLTPEGGQYHVTAQDGRIVVSNAHSGRNNREIYWNPNTPTSPSATQCATWTSGEGIGQNGLAFRIQNTADGGTNAIVFERNIWAYAFWKFVPIMFHSGPQYAEDFEGVEGIDLSPYLGVSDSAVWPLRVCASLDAENVLRFAVAKGDDAMPPLDQPGLQGGSWKLDIDSYFHSGEGLAGHNGGIYAAHVPTDSSLVFEDITLNGVPVSLTAMP